MKIQKISLNQEIESLDFLNFLNNNRKTEIIKTSEWLKVRYLHFGKGGSHSKWVYLPKTIKITPDLVKSVGIYYGEGDKSKNRVHTRFTNSEISVIRTGIELFKSLDIKEQGLKGYIKTYNHEISDKNLIRYWSKASRIPKNNFFKVARYTSRKRYIRNRSSPSRYGRLEVYFSSVVIRDVIDVLIKLIKQNSIKDQSIGWNFIKGLIAGENREQIFIRRLLKSVGIKSSEANYKFYVAISNLDNFRKLKKVDAFEVHPQKREKFTLGFNYLAPGE